MISGFGAWEEKTKGYSVETNSTRSTIEYFPYYPLVSNVTIVPELKCSVNSFLQFIRFDFFIGGYISYYKYLDSVFKYICHVNYSNGTKVETGKPKPTDSGGPLVSLSGPNNTPELWGIILKTKVRFLYDEAQFFVFLSVAQYQTWVHSVIDSFS